MQEKAIQDKIRQYEELVVPVDNISMITRSWTTAAADLPARITKGVKSSCQKLPKNLTGGETLSSLSACDRGGRSGGCGTPSGGCSLMFAHICTLKDRDWTANPQDDDWYTEPHFTREEDENVTICCHCLDTLDEGDGEIVGGECSSCEGPIHRYPCLKMDNPRCLKLKCKLLHPKAVKPTRMTEGSIGYDLTAVEDVEIEAGTSKLIPLGLALELPIGCYGRIAPRSSLAREKQLAVNAGVIDPDFRGEVRVMLTNLSRHDAYIQAGERCAQLILERALMPPVAVVDEIDDGPRSKSSARARGTSGFGSTDRASAAEEPPRSVPEPKAESQPLPAPKSSPKVHAPKGPPVPKKPSAMKSLAPDQVQEKIPDQSRNSVGSGARVDAEPAQDQEPLPPLRVADAAEAKRFSDLFGAARHKKEMSEGHKQWMKRLRSGDFEGPQPKRAQFLELVDDNGKSIEIKEDPRAAPEYKDRCVQEAGLGKHFDQKRYPELTKQVDRDLLEWAVRRGSGCIWLEGSPRTYVRGFKHRLITKGPPVKMGLHRLSREATEWVEKAIAADVARG